ncbi:uncharacterized protein LOC113685010 isoform X4 [Pocillopora damicornis]|uniref:uncharacterized protein LOC113685010 isoform X4 n=1 Tax=Pocillopora damicornis TaxID=46731 RepID=UPI000F55106D|nr:uncharacterized protein LOC113685010 isoform X4 [Pocillopora damicornis]
MDPLEVLRGSELDDDGLMDPPLQIMTETSESEGSDEILFEPPPMFASSDEAEIKEEVEDSDVLENGYEGDLPSPVIPSSLLEVQPQEDKRFHNLALEVWTEDDCVDWLDFIGLGHFATEFREHHVDGRVLKNINFQLLEEIGINSPDEREVILSEIYRRFHPEEEDMFEMEIQGALQSASEKEKMKIMAVLNALRSPAFQAELGLDTSTGSSSPHGSEAGFYMGAETGSISSGVTTGSEDHSQDINMPPPPPPPSWSQTAKKTKSLGRELDDYEIIPKGGKSKKPGKTSKDKDKSGEKSSKSEKHGRKEKKHKRVTRLLDSLSLSTSSSKLTKLFHHSSSSSSSATKKLNPTMQYLLQAGPQGLIRIWPTALSEEMNYCSFMVNMTTTSAEIIKLVFEKYELVDDPRRYYVCEMGLGKGGSRHDLTDADCPLLRQCRWTDPDKQRFELRCRDEGVIKMLFELEGYEDDLDYRSIPLSAKTPCTEAVELIVKKFQLPGKANEYYLVEVSEECEDDREEVADHVCPLRLQMAWSAPDHVFRLCRRPTDSSTDVNDVNKDTIDGWMTDATEDASHEPGITSEVSSVRDKDELEFAPVPGRVEGNEIKEEISEDLMEGLNELDQVIDEESEVIASQELEAVRHELAAKEEELKELRLRSDTLNEREDELISLRRENEELKMRSVARGRLSEKDESLVEKDRALEELRQENEELRRRIDDLEEKLKNETAMRDREIERLYARNNELSSNEKELENLRQLRDTCDSQEKELEKLRLMNQESSSGQNELASRLAELKQKHNELLMEVNEMEKLKQVNRELTRKVDEGDMFRQELEKSQAQKKELVEKLKELERERRESKKGENDRVENLRQKNLEVAAKSKDAEEMRTNIIKLTAQMREMEKQSQERANKLQKELEDAASEKQQLLDRIAELEESERSQAQKKDAENNAKEVEDLKLENIFLVERTKEVDELKSAVAKLAAEAKENESFKQKYKELRDVETYLTKQVSTAETIARQKDKKLKESENKINTLTEAVKDMEAKLEEHEQNKLYLDQLLAMLKDRDPTLLHVINTSLASSEQEEWC